MDTSTVAAVFVGGRVRKWEGKMLGVDLVRLRHQAEQARDDLVRRASYANPLFETCCAPVRTP